MRSSVALATAALLASAASAGTAPSIGRDSIAGAKLGLRAAAYKRLLGKPVRKDFLQQPSGWSRLFFAKRKVAVYFKPGGRKAAVITTWNPAYKTAERIGPCSSIDELKTAYGDEVKPSPPDTLGDHDADPTNDRVYAYTVGKLIFGANGRDPTPGPSKHVTAVGLYSGVPGPEQGGALGYAGFVTLALNKASC